MLFRSECAIVTHTRLRATENGGIEVDPDSKLEEEVIVRPTSETVIWSMYKKWIQSYRDLPLLINQWANVVRWEMRTRLFLRTTEFLWQEGHTAHATPEEAEEEALTMLEVYRRLAEDVLAIPVLTGTKSLTEKFAGAEHTYCIEAMMQDGKALQSGTSHFLGQNFAKAFDVKFLDKTGKLDYVWATSWGVSTRLMGALIMAHSDDHGLVLPPRLAPIQVVIVPIYRKEEELNKISLVAGEIRDKLTKLGISVKYDDRDTRKPGWKFAEYEMRGVPIRIAIGPRDLEHKTAEVARRDILKKESLPLDTLETTIPALLNEIQEQIYRKAEHFRDTHIFEADSWDEFCDTIEHKGGFVKAHWDGTTETELAIKEKTKATIRCIPVDKPAVAGKCILTGKPSKQRVIFARAY